MQRDEDRNKFTAAVTLGERAGNIKDLINLAQNLDCYWLYPTVQNEEDYGYYLIDELDELELPEEAKKYFMQPGALWEKASIPVLYAAASEVVVIPDLE